MATDCCAEILLAIRRIQQLQWPHDAHGSTCQRALVLAVWWRHRRQRIGYAFVFVRLHTAAHPIPELLQRRCCVVLHCTLHLGSGGGALAHFSTISLGPIHSKVASLAEF